MVRPVGDCSLHNVRKITPNKSVSAVAKADLGCFRALVNKNEPTLRVYLTGDGPDVYEDSFMSIAKPEGGEFHPTLVLIGTRLGIDKITPVYWEALIATLQMPQSVGIAGYVQFPCTSVGGADFRNIVAVPLHPTTSSASKGHFSSILIPITRDRPCPTIPARISTQTTMSTLATRQGCAEYILER